MTVFEWITLVVSVVICLGGFIAWLVHVSISLGKMIAELHSIRESLTGFSQWLKSVDDKVVDHERRITKLEVEVQNE